MCWFKITYYRCRRCHGKLTGTAYENPQIVNIARDTNTSYYCPGRDSDSVEDCPNTVKVQYRNYWCRKTSCKEDELITMGVRRRQELTDILINDGYEPPEYVLSNVEIYDDYYSPTNGFYRTYSLIYLQHWGKKHN